MTQVAVLTEMISNWRSAASALRQFAEAEFDRVNAAEMRGRADGIEACADGLTVALAAGGGHEFS